MLGGKKITFEIIDGRSDVTLAELTEKLDKYKRQNPQIARFIELKSLSPTEWAIQAEIPAGWYPGKIISKFFDTINRSSYEQASQFLSKYRMSRFDVKNPWVVVFDDSGVGVIDFRQEEFPTLQSALATIPRIIADRVNYDEVIKASSEDKGAGSSFMIVHVHNLEDGGDYSFELWAKSTDTGTGVKVDAAEYENMPPGHDKEFEQMVESVEKVFVDFYGSHGDVPTRKQIADQYYHRKQWLPERSSYEQDLVVRRLKREDVTVHCGYHNRSETILMNLWGGGMGRSDVGISQFWLGNVHLCNVFIDDWNSLKPGDPKYSVSLNQEERLPLEEDRDNVKRWALEEWIREKQPEYLKDKNRMAATGWYRLSDATGQDRKRIVANILQAFNISTPQDMAKHRTWAANWAAYNDTAVELRGVGAPTISAEDEKRLQHTVDYAAKNFIELGISSPVHVPGASGPPYDWQVSIYVKSIDPEVMAMVGHVYTMPGGRTVVSMFRNR